MVHAARLGTAMLATILAIASAAASQGPGIAAGTASPLTQHLMAIVVYGASALVIAYGLIGAVRGR